MKWHPEDEIRLFAHTLEVHAIKPNLSALAARMGPGKLNLIQTSPNDDMLTSINEDVTAKALSHRFALIRSRIATNSTNDPNHMLVSATPENVAFSAANSTATKHNDTTNILASHTTKRKRKAKDDNSLHDSSDAATDLTRHQSKKRKITGEDLTRAFCVLADSSTVKKEDDDSAMKDVDEHDSKDEDTDVTVFNL
ncbi:uncharacterized protein KY384_000180 [Bacidia gigantensis]|uniref:uncharacterized protein n=1 Tax=Bacidia gigantensis TaxID=2732470 RepID=UPI001D03DF08|nr:uncharacterized protein KY384_000180 [Bacidia gigantensis]KAG8526187.1 hypothetical protein KY384_000180 [Bacidia gigantensis]